MYFGGAYLGYSEVFRRTPPSTGILESLRPLLCEETFVTLSRMNNVIRRSHEVDAKRESAVDAAQKYLAENFLSRDAIAALKSNLPPTTKMHERPLFHNHQLLILLRASLTECRGSANPALNRDAADLIGDASLITSDETLRVDEQLSIKVGSDQQRRLHLMVQLLSPFEITNALRPRNALFRSHVLFRILLLDQDVIQDIEARASGFRFDRAFTQATRLELQSWLRLIFATYAYCEKGSNPLDPESLRFREISSGVFLAKTAVSASEAAVFLNTVASDFAGYRQQFASFSNTDPRYDFTPFRSRPVLRLSSGQFICVDLAFVLEKLVTGVHWLIHDSLPATQRNSLFSAWGILFEHYCNWLLHDLPHFDIQHFARPNWAAPRRRVQGKESFDAVLIKNDTMVAIECKGGFLHRAGKYSGSPRQFLRELHRKVGSGSKQLAVKIRKLFSAEPGRGTLESIDTSGIRRVLPVLIVQDHCLRGPFVNWILNRWFQQRVRNVSWRDGVEVFPMNVITASELEALMESADACGCDPTYALYLRALRDPEMLSDAHNFFITQVRGYGMHGSRVRDDLDRVIQSELQALFP